MHFLPQIFHSWGGELTETEHESREVLGGVWLGALTGILTQTVDEVVCIRDGVLVGFGLGMSVLQRDRPKSSCKKVRQLSTLTLSLLKSIMETCSVVRTFESVDEILWCDHSNETSSLVLLYGSIQNEIWDISLVLTFYTLGSAPLRHYVKLVFAVVQLELVISIRGAHR